MWHHRQLRQRAAGRSRSTTARSGLRSRQMFGLAPLPRTLDAAVRDLSDRKPEVRLSAVRDLARWAGDAAQAPGAAIAALERALVEDGQASVRAEAALALADAAAASAVPSLLRAAEQDPSARVRQLAVLALGELGEQDDERIGALVAEALDDAA